MLNFVRNARNIWGNLALVYTRTVATRTTTRSEACHAPQAVLHHRGLPDGDLRHDPRRACRHRRPPRREDGRHRAHRVEHRPPYAARRPRGDYAFEGDPLAAAWP